MIGPRAMFNRLLGRPAKAFVGGYNASRLGRRLQGWDAERRNINTLLMLGGDQLRARARQLCRENPYASNAVEAFVSSAVGGGIKPSSLLEDAAVKKELQAAWLEWTDEADADGLTDFYGLQALAARALFEAGECFVRFRPRRAEDGLSVPLQLQILEAEHLPFDHNEQLANGNTVRAGIEFDQIGRRTAYHFLRNHPGEAALNFTGLDKTVVPAAEVMHLYRPLRPGQIRGQPAIVPGMIRLYLLDQYDDAELDRKRVAAMFAGFVTKPRPEDGSPVPLDPQRADKEGQPLPPEVALAGLEPGTLQVLMEGEDIKFSNPSEVGGSYEAFMYRSLLAISAAVGLPYHAITADVGKSNYSSLRASQVEARRRMDQFQHMTLVFQMCRPIWQRWVETALLSGRLSPAASRLYRSNRSAFTAVKWIPPKWEWVDPWKDRKAEELAQDNGWKSRSDIIEGEGYDPEEVDARIKADRNREEKLGLDFRPVEDKNLDQPIETAAQDAA